MRIYTELNLNTFGAWSGAVDTLEKIKEAGKCDELEVMLEELYPDGMSETQLNDLLWFEDEWLFEILGITDNEDEEEFELFESFCSQFIDCKYCPYVDELTMEDCKTRWNKENNK